MGHWGGGGDGIVQLLDPVCVSSHPLGAWLLWSHQSCGRAMRLCPSRQPTQGGEAGQLDLHQQGVEVRDHDLNVSPSE